jgi:hypothetical protein
MLSLKTLQDVRTESLGGDGGIVATGVGYPYTCLATPRRHVSQHSDQSNITYREVELFPNRY